MRTQAAKTIVVIDGHPDRNDRRFVHALANSYAAGARAGGHNVHVVEVATLRFDLLRTADDFEHGVAPTSIESVQALVRSADHLVLIFPLWLGSMPALMKGFLEQLLRPGFAFAYQKSGLPKKMLTGKTAHVVVTMGMPGFFYKWYYRAHSLKSLERNILQFVGIKPMRSTVIGMVGEEASKRRANWLKKLQAFGRDAH